MYCLCGLYVILVIFYCKLIFGSYSSVEKCLASVEDASSRYDFHLFLQEARDCCKNCNHFLIHIQSMRNPRLIPSSHPLLHLAPGLTSWLWVYRADTVISFVPVQLYCLRSTQNSLGFCWLFSLENALFAVIQVI